MWLREEVKAIPCCFKCRLKSRQVLLISAAENGAGHGAHSKVDLEQGARVDLQCVCVFILKAGLVGGMQDREHGVLDSSITGFRKEECIY